MAKSSPTSLRNAPAPRPAGTGADTGQGNKRQAERLAAAHPCGSGNLPKYRTTTLSTNAPDHLDDAFSFQSPSIHYEISGLDDQVQIHLAILANRKGVDFSVLVNDLLRKDLELIEMAQ